MAYLLNLLKRRNKAKNEPKLPRLSVKVRPLEEKDCYKVLEMIHEHVFMGNAKGICKDIIQGKTYLVFVGGSSLLLFFYTRSMIWANIWFFSIFLLGYLYLMYGVCRAFYYKGPDTNSPEEFYEHWSNNDEGRYMWVAERDDGKVVGAAGVVNESPTTASVKRLVTTSDAQRRGVGTELMLTLLDSCVAREIGTVEVSITYKQLAAQQLFKRFGFRTNLEGFFLYGTRPFFRVRSAKYVLSLERND